MSETTSNGAQVSNSVENVQGDSSAHSEPVASQVAAPTAPSKLKIDWEDGNAEELSIDDLIADYKTSKKSASEMKKQMDPVMQFLNALQSGELDQLEALGLSEDQILQFAEKRLQRHVEWMRLSPEERTQKKKMLELEAENAEAKKIKEREAARRQAEVDQQVSTQLQKEIVEAVEGLGLGHKPTPRLIRRVAEQMAAQILAKQNADPKRAAKYEWDGMQRDLLEYQLMAVKANPSQFVESLPPEVRQAIREYELKGAKPFAKPTREEEEIQAPKTKGQVVDLDYLEKLYGPKKKRVNK